MGPSCTCPDAEKRDVVCKHIRRAIFATRARPVPGYVQRDALDDMLGQHGDGCPRIGQVATDGGPEQLESAAESGEDGDRPADCDCPVADMPCWPCYRDGHDSPNPAVECCRRWA